MERMDLSRLATDPKFKNLSVEETIRYMGEQEKVRITKERDRVIQTLESKMK